MGYYLGKTEVRPTDEENSEYVRLFNLYVYDIKEPNEPERRENGYVDWVFSYSPWLSLAYRGVARYYQFYWKEDDEKIDLNLAAGVGKSTLLRRLFLFI